MLDVSLYAGWGIGVGIAVLVLLLWWAMSGHMPLLTRFARVVLVVAVAALFGLVWPLAVGVALVVGLSGLIDLATYEDGADE